LSLDEALDAACISCGHSLLPLLDAFTSLAIRAPSCDGAR
jgi:hypothetical protein